jgi:hypothetical protein
MRSDLRGSFIVRGLDPDDVSERLSMTSDFSWREGDPVSSAPEMTRSESAWGLESRLSSDAGLEEHVVDLLDRLAGAEQLINSLGARSVEIVVSVWSFDGDRPLMVLTRETIRGLADLGAEFGIDLYVVGDLEV